jgi:hypothetical protein
MVGNMVLQEYYKTCINTTDAQYRKQTVIRHITENMKCDPANNNNNNNNNNNKRKCSPLYSDTFPCQHTDSIHVR